MDVKQMTYILTIAQEGGISKAAAKLFITQSALDQQLLKLEPASFSAPAAALPSLRPAGSTRTTPAGCWS